MLHLSLPAHRQRLVSVQSILSQPRQTQVHYNGTNTRKSSLEKDIHQRKLFEYFLVVSLQKSKAGAHYLPEVTQQFPPKVRSNLGLNSSLNFLRMKCVKSTIYLKIIGYVQFVHKTMQTFSRCIYSFTKGKIKLKCIEVLLLYCSWSEASSS